MSGDEPVSWKKIAECVPREDTDIDTNEKYVNYDDPDWSSDDWDWLKNEDGTNIKITDVVKVNNNVFGTSFNGSFNLSGSTASTTLTVSSSFSTTLDFRSNRIMTTHSVQPLTMSIDADVGILGNVVMTDISASGLHLTSSEFKILNGTFDNTKRNYVYYHYIGNDTALVTINQES